jgi:hypothetical protein
MASVQKQTVTVWIVGIRGSLVPNEKFFASLLRYCYDNPLYTTQKQFPSDVRANWAQLGV